MALYAKFLRLYFPGKVKFFLAESQRQVVESIGGRNVVALGMCYITELIFCQVISCMLDNFIILLFIFFLHKINSIDVINSLVIAVNGLIPIVLCISQVNQFILQNVNWFHIIVKKYTTEGVSKVPVPLDNYHIPQLHLRK